MNVSEIALQRMDNQGLANPIFATPTDVVAWNGAVQAQDYAGAKWAVAQRIKGFINDAEMDQAFNNGAILRTHLMRPTWHFVARSDIHWLLALTAPRVHAANAYYYRTLGLDTAVFMQSNNAMIAALEGGKHLTRNELATTLLHAGINAEGLRLAYLLMQAELDGILCSGPRRGKQFTYALLEERVPQANLLAKDEACAELTRRYFRSHGPAMLKDFVWWSGLTVTEAKEGIELVKSELHHEIINDQSYWSPITRPPTKAASPQAYLLPNYDEALASFKDYSAAVSPQFEKMWASGNPLFPHYLVIDGWVVGSWKRTFAKGTVIIETKPFAPLSTAEYELLAAAAHRFGDFLGMSVELRQL